MPIYMNWGGGQTPEIRGDVDDPVHRGWIELNSAQLGVTSPAGQSRQKQAPKVSEIVVTKVLDSTSPNLFHESLQGKATKVQLDLVTTTGPTPYVSLTMTLSDVMISGYSQGGGGKGAVETLRLKYSSVEWGPGKDVTPHTTAPPTYLMLQACCTP